MKKGTKREKRQKPEPEAEAGPEVEPVTEAEPGPGPEPETNGICEGFRKLFGIFCNFSGIEKKFEFINDFYYLIEFIEKKFEIFQILTNVQNLWTIATKIRRFAQIPKVLLIANVVKDFQNWIEKLAKPRKILQTRKRQIFNKRQTTWKRQTFKK